MKASPTYLVLIHFYDVISCYSFISWIYSLTTYLVGGIPTLWKIWKSVEIRIVIANPNMWKVKDVPNNQPYIYIYTYICICMAKIRKIWSHKHPSGQMIRPKKSGISGHRCPHTAETAADSAVLPTLLPAAFVAGAMEFSNSWWQKENFYGEWWMMQCCGHRCSTMFDLHQRPGNSSSHLFF